MSGDRRSGCTIPVPAFRGTFSVCVARRHHHSPGSLCLLFRIKRALGVMSNDRWWTAVFYAARMITPQADSLFASEMWRRLWPSTTASIKSPPLSIVTLRRPRKPQRARGGVSPSAASRAELILLHTGGLLIAIPDARECLAVSRTGWKAAARDQVIRGSTRRPLADPGAEIEGARANRADASERNLGGSRPKFAKRSNRTSADGVRARQLAEEPARVLGRKAA